MAIFRQTAANFATDDIGAENFNSCPPPKKKLPHNGVFTAPNVFLKPNFLPRRKFSDGLKFRGKGQLPPLATTPLSHNCMRAIWTAKRKKIRYLPQRCLRYKSQTRDQKRFTVSEVAADCHELKWHRQRKLDLRSAAIRHTTAPTSYTRSSPCKLLLISHAAVYTVCMYKLSYNIKYFEYRSSQPNNGQVKFF